MHACAVALLLTVTMPGAIDSAGATPRPVPVILDTDMAGDCDDTGALALLNHLQDLGEARVLACMVDSREKSGAVAAAITAINAYYGRGDVPIGTYHGTHGHLIASTYVSRLRDEFAPQVPPDFQQPDAVPLYRRLLAAAPDASVTVVSIGFLTNLAALLDSPPDGFSPLAGRDLVRARVRELVVMGGAFPHSDPQHGEYNFANYDVNDTRKVLEQWPTPVLLSGFEIGAPVITGRSLAQTPTANPVRRAYELSFHNCLQTGRSSWDLTAVLAAVRDPGLYWNVSAPGLCVVLPNGANQWRDDPRGHQRYLIRKMAPDELARLLDDLIAAPSRGR